MNGEFFCLLAFHIIRIKSLNPIVASSGAHKTLSNRPWTWWGTLWELSSQILRWYHPHHHWRTVYDEVVINCWLWWPCFCRISGSWFWYRSRRWLWLRCSIPSTSTVSESICFTWRSWLLASQDGHQASLLITLSNESEQEYSFFPLCKSFVLHSMRRNGSCSVQIFMLVNKSRSVSAHC